MLAHFTTFVVVCVAGAFPAVCNAAAAAAAVRRFRITVLVVIYPQSTLLFFFFFLRLEVAFVLSRFRTNGSSAIAHPESVHSID